MAWDQKNQTVEFNVELEHSRTTLYILTQYLQIRQTPTPDRLQQMYNAIESAINFNYGRIPDETINQFDKQLETLRTEIPKVNIKSHDGYRHSPEQEQKVLTQFQQLYRQVMNTLNKKGITQKITQSPGEAFSNIDQ